MDETYFRARGSDDWLEPCLPPRRSQDEEAPDHRSYPPRFYRPGWRDPLPPIAVTINDVIGQGYPRAYLVQDPETCALHLVYVPRAGCTDLIAVQVDLDVWLPNISTLPQVIRRDAADRVASENLNLTPPIAGSTLFSVEDLMHCSPPIATYAPPGVCGANAWVRIGGGEV